MFESLSNMSDGIAIVPFSQDPILELNAIRTFLDGRCLPLNSNLVSTWLPV